MDAEEIDADESITDMENMVTDVADGMDEALIDNPELKESLKQSLKEIKESVARGDIKDPTKLINTLGPFNTFDKGLTDSKLLSELQEAERQAQQTATIITELKQSVAQLLEKPHMTDLENIELEQKNKQLAQLLQDFENRTKQIQMIVGQIDKRANKLMPAPESSEPKQIQDEEMLPKVIICGTTENCVPKIIICDSSDKKKKSKIPPQIQPPPASSVMPQFARRLTESYNMQEKLVEENANLEGTRYHLQEEIINKDQTVECLRQKVNCLQSELRVVVKENTILAEKLNKISEPNRKSVSRPGSAKSRDTCNCCKRSNMDQHVQPSSPRKGICPGDVESRLQNYSNITNCLEKQLGQMEAQVKCMQIELENVQRERMALEQQKQSLLGTRCAGPCAPSTQTSGRSGGFHLYAGGGYCPCDNELGASPISGTSTVDQQIRELREQYARLQEDYRDKMTEVAQLRADVETLKQNVRESELAKEQAEQAMKDKEREIRILQLEMNKYSGNKEQRADQEQQLALAKQKLYEAQDELDELRSIVGDQTAQLEEYRNKYMQAQQNVEELRRQLDMMELENQRISDQVNLEIQRVKNQFQEKLQELIPLPDILKATQLKLQECQQLQLNAERRAEKLELELERSKDKEAAALAELEKLKEEGASDSANAISLRKKLEASEKKIAEMEAEINANKKEIACWEDKCLLLEKELDEKKHEVTMLNSQLTQLREESARQVARAKERTETVRRSLQTQIADLEKELAQSRAACRSAQKERDEIRQKMQCQINNLNESFEQAQSRIRSLQGHVNYLKTSYSTMFHETGDGNQGDAIGCTCNLPV